MVFNTATVSTAITPAVVACFFRHYLDRQSRAQKPTAHISYDQGITLIRRFLEYASHHTVEELQRFTSQWVPHPAWVKIDTVPIGNEHLERSAALLVAQLGKHGVQRVGGKTWWRWRRAGSPLTADWIEMRSDWAERRKEGGQGRRTMLYVHGGAYFFGSVDEHRYQMQRHARKLRARVFARCAKGASQTVDLLTDTARYRLAPQFPFPCAVYDCLAAYLHLLTVQDPTTIVFAGDSAGAGMLLSILVILRDQNIPLPAGAILISPWVDLTHSFPSVSGDSPFDYIPPHGFHQKPSASWPPPTTEDMLTMEERLVKRLTLTEPSTKQAEQDAIQGFKVHSSPHPDTENDTAASNDEKVTRPRANTVPGTTHDLSIMIDGKLIELKDQIQMYTTNSMLSHPLVSPILQPSLGGLPPLLVLVGGGEMLRDEQIYLAHKAANPQRYPPGDAFLEMYPGDHAREEIHKWKPTDVQLQVWDDLCHVAPTLSFTRPAKYMYRSVAQFGAWALARAQKRAIDILDDDDVSVISSSDSDGEKTKQEKAEAEEVAANTIGKAGDTLPAFENHMIRQRVDRHGNVFPLAAPSDLAACCMDTADIGVIKPGPVRKWMKAKSIWDAKYASSKRRIQRQRAQEMAQGYQTFGDGEVPPPSALAGRRLKNDTGEEAKPRKNYGMALWSLVASKHDKDTMIREQQADAQPDTVTATPHDGAGARPLFDRKTSYGKRLGLNGSVEAPGISRSRSRHRSVEDEEQVERGMNTSMLPVTAGGNYPQEDMPMFDASNRGHFAGMTHGNSSIPSIKINDEEEELETDLKRPKAGGIAFPFSLNHPAASVSVATLTSVVGVPPIEDVRIAGVMTPGLDASPGTSGAATPTTDGPSAKDLKPLIIDEKKIEELLGSSVVAKPVGESERERKGLSLSASRPGVGHANGLSPTATTTTSPVAGGRLGGSPLKHSEKPPLENFVTAREELPLVRKKG